METRMVSQLWNVEDLEELTNKARVRNKILFIYLIYYVIKILLSTLVIKIYFMLKIKMLKKENR